MAVGYGPVAANRPSPDHRWTPRAWLSRGAQQESTRRSGRARGGESGASSTESAVRAAERLVAAVSLHHNSAIERLLAMARLVVATVIAVALWHGAAPEHFEVVHLFAATYTGYALLVLAVIWNRVPLSQVAGNSLHIADLGWAAVIVASSGGVSSHAYPLFAFVIIGAGYRWGLRRTLLDGTVVVVLSLLCSAVSIAGLTPWPFEPDNFVMRVGYIGVLTLLFGVMSGGQLALRFQALAVGGLLSRLSQHTLVVPAVRDLLAELVEVFGAARVALVVHDHSVSAPTLWTTARTNGGTRDFSRRALMAYERSVWLYPLPDGASACELRRQAPPGLRSRMSDEPSLRPESAVATQATMVLDGAGKLAPAPVSLDAGSVTEFEWTTALVATVMQTPRWHARVCVFDPTLKPQGYVRLTFLLNLATQLGAPLMNLHLLRQIRLDAATSERSRVARELHDGAIQTLVSLEMRLEVLRRRVELYHPALSVELGELQTVTRGGTADLRELIQQIRPVAMHGSGLGLPLAELVNRFGRDHQIESAFEWAAGRIEFAYHQSHEVYKLVQEALVNVRRHSAATRVRVRLEADASGALLVVEDNGRGLGFEGRMTHEQLAAEHTGPRVLRERLEHMGGRLVAESSPTGTRLEMTFPHEIPD